jgi:hypothetical protein
MENQGLNKMVALDKNNVLRIETTNNGESFNISINGTITPYDHIDIDEVIQVLEKAWVHIINLQ